MKKNRLNLLILAIFVLLLQGMNQQDPMIATMARLLHDRTKEKIELKMENQRLNFQIRLLQIDIEETEVAHSVIMFYKNHGADMNRNPYCVDPKHLKRIWQYVKKYDYIMKDIKWDGNIRRFVMAYIVDQSGFNTNCVNFNTEKVGCYPTRKDGTPNPFYKTYDLGIAQFNQITEPIVAKDWNKWIKESLEVVKARNKDEYYIALFYIHLYNSAYKGESWAKLSSEPSRGWNFYYETRKVIN